MSDIIFKECNKQELEEILGAPLILDPKNPPVPVKDESQFREILERRGLTLLDDPVINDRIRSIINEKGANNYLFLSNKEKTKYYHIFWDDIKEPIDTFAVFESSNKQVDPSKIETPDNK